MQVRGSDLVPSTTIFLSQESSIRKLLLKELKKTSDRLNRVPQPYCELDCPWMTFCSKYGFDWCILITLIETNLLSESLGSLLQGEFSW